MPLITASSDGDIVGRTYVCARSNRIVSRANASTDYPPMAIRCSLVRRPVFFGNREVIAEPTFLAGESCPSVPQRIAHGPQTGSAHSVILILVQRDPKHKEA